MDRMRIVRLIVVCGAFLAAGPLLLYIEHSQQSPPLPAEYLTASNTYLGPIRPVPGNPQLIQVQVLVRDSPEATGVQIVSADFDGKSIPLKPRDIYGNRGEASFQVKSGKYKLCWKVNKDKFAWPRTVKHEEEVTVNPRDLWLQISIEGEEASIH